MSSTHATLTLFERLHAACRDLNEDKIFHEQAGHQWSIDSGKLQRALSGHQLSVQLDPAGAEASPDPQTLFTNHANHNGWTRDTQVNVLIEFIRNQSLSGAFDAFLKDKTDFENPNAEPIGKQQAEAAIKANPSLSLFECEVTVTWAHGPFDESESMTVFVASTDAGQAMDLAEQSVCQHFNDPRVQADAQDAELIQLS